MISGGPPARAVVASALVVVLAYGTAVVPAAGVTSPAAAPGPAVTPDTCFPDSGAEFVVGTEGPQIRLTLHLSLLSALFAGDAEADGPTARADEADGPRVAAGALGIEAAATAGGARIVSLRSGVLFEGGTGANLLAQPFAPFALAFDYRLTIPAFAGTVADGDYRESDVPVSGPVEEAACST
jgi:hypothetical protein